MIVDGANGAAGPFTLSLQTGPADASFGYWRLGVPNTFQDIADPMFDMGFGTGAASDTEFKDIVLPFQFNFYGTDYVTNPAEKAAGATGMDSDRVFANWELNSARVKAFASGEDFPLGKPDVVIEIPGDYSTLLRSDPGTAKREQLRVREEFLAALGAGLVGRAFSRDADRPSYLFYREA